MTAIPYLPVYINHLYRQCVKHWMKRQVRTKVVGIAARRPYCCYLSKEGLQWQQVVEWVFDCCLWRHGRCVQNIHLHYSDLSLYNICIPEIYGTKICWLVGLARARFDFQVHSETTRNRVETSSQIPWFFDPCQCYDNTVYKSGVDLFMLHQQTLELLCSHPQCCIAS